MNRMRKLIIMCCIGTVALSSRAEFDVKIDPQGPLCICDNKDRTFKVKITDPPKVQSECKIKTSITWSLSPEKETAKLKATTETAPESATLQHTGTELNAGTYTLTVRVQYDEFAEEGQNPDPAPRGVNFLSDTDSITINIVHVKIETRNWDHGVVPLLYLKTYYNNSAQIVDFPVSSQGGPMFYSKIQVRAVPNPADACADCCKDWEVMWVQNELVPGTMKWVYNDCNQNPSLPEAQYPAYDSPSAEDTKKQLTECNQWIDCNAQDSPGWHGNDVKPYYWNKPAEGYGNPLKRLEIKESFMITLVASNKVTHEMRYLNWVKWSMNVAQSFNIGPTPPQGTDDPTGTGGIPNPFVVKEDDPGGSGVSGGSPQPIFIPKAPKDGQVQCP